MYMCCHVLLIYVRDSPRLSLSIGLNLWLILHVHLFLFHLLNLCGIISRSCDHCYLWIGLSQRRCIAVLCLLWLWSFPCMVTCNHVTWDPLCDEWLLSTESETPTESCSCSVCLCCSAFRVLIDLHLYSSLFVFVFFVFVFFFFLSCQDVISHLDPCSFGA